MYHTIIIVGNLGRDPEMRYTPNGQAVTNLNIAVDDSYTDSQGERIKKTIWVRVSVWGKMAESCNEYLQKGKRVLVEGRLVCDPSTGGPRVYQRQDGTSGASFEVSARNVRFLTPRGEGDDTYQSVESTPDTQISETDEEIPF
jgi:single-strand DNA-binding protein